MADWKDIASSVATFAPTIGAAIGGPVGSVVGFGVKALCSVFGIEPEAEDAKEQLAKAIEKMTPEQAVEMKKADNQFQVDMKKLEIDVFRLEVADRSSARKRERDVGSFDNRVLAFLVVSSFMALVFGVVFSDAFNVMDATKASMVGTLVGYVSAKAEQVIAYYFGSSKGSADKTVAMNTAFNSMKR